MYKLQIWISQAKTLFQLIIGKLCISEPEFDKHLHSVLFVCSWKQVSDLGSPCFYPVIKCNYVEKGVIEKMYICKPGFWMDRHDI